MTESLSHMDTQWFWGIKQKHMYDHFKTFPIVPGHVVNLSQLKNSHFPLTSYLKAPKVSLFFILCGLEMFDEVLHLLYVNLWNSPNSGELESFVLGKRFIINENLFKDVFGTKFSRVIWYIL